LWPFGKGRAETHTLVRQKIEDTGKRGVRRVEWQPENREKKPKLPGVVEKESQ